MLKASYCSNCVQVIEFSDESVSRIDGLESGWFLGRNIDLFDTQWREFRGGLPVLIAFAAMQSVLAKFGRNHSTSAHVVVQLVAGLSYVLVLHGYRLVYIFLLVVGNFGVSVSIRGSWQPAAVWIFNLCALVVVSGTGEYWDIPSLSGFAGMTSWAHHFNMVMLKLISFGVDYGRRPQTLAKEEPESLDYKARQETVLQDSDYSFLNFVSYVFYSPLYLAGPIVSFNAWRSYLVKPKSVIGREILLYGVRWIIIFLLMEVFTHYMYCNAIAASKSVVFSLEHQILDLGRAFSLSLYVLFFMWMKFTLIWRFFRLWSLLNGIDCPENMNRCVFHNYSVAQFWKSWHSSFNLWLIRYVYVPLGGASKNKFMNILMVFTFVALWHDLTWRVFHWAWIVSGIFAPELVGTYLWRTSQFFTNLRENHPLLARQVKTVAVMGNMLLLMASNMVGYVFGAEGLAALVSKNQVDLKSIGFLLATLASGANIQLILDNMYR